MVRLVFRPYTRVRRSICTSESLRASTRVSSGFALLGHSSPSFGSQPVRSRSTFRLRGAFPAGARCGGMRPQPPLPAGTVTLIARTGLLAIQPLALAHRLDSLVRVSRRGEGSARLPPRSGVVRMFPPAPRTVSPRGSLASEGASVPPTGCRAGRDMRRPPGLPARGNRARRAPLHPISDFKVFELSFQNSFHLSLTVLVRYRSPARIEP